MKTITVYYKNVYGNELCYPKCETAKKLAKLTNSKNFHSHSPQRHSITRLWNSCRCLQSQRSRGRYVKSR